MTIALDRVRDIALLLPGTAERDDAFLVADAVFVEVQEGAIRVRGDDGWDAIDLTGDPDWTFVEDRIARSWELAAPRDLLEAGGR